MPQEDQRALQKLLDEASEHIERGIQQPLERKRHDEAELRRAKRTISEWQQTLDVHSPAAEDQLSARTSTRCETSVPRSTGAPKKYFSRVIFSRSTGVYARAERAGSAPAIFSKQVTHISNQGMEPLAVEPPQAHVPHQENPPKKPTVKAPLLDSVGLKAWQDLLGLIDEAEKRGADLSGVFVVPLATDIDGAELAATRTPGFIDCFKSVLKPSESGITSLSYEGKSLFNMGQVPECPKACSAEEVIRDFEGRLYSQGEAFRPAPYAVNVDTADADDPKQRTNHLLSKHSVFDHFLVNGLRRTKISYPGIHTPQIFVTAQKSGDHSARTEISIYRQSITDQRPSECVDHSGSNTPGPIRDGHSERIRYRSGLVLAILEAQILVDISRLSGSAWHPAQCRTPRARADHSRATESVSVGTQRGPERRRSCQLVGQSCQDWRLHCL